MAPKLSSSVRSESWLDLTAAGRLELTNSNSRDDQIYDQPASEYNHHRHSLADFGPSAAANNQHLLIRLRQQSYLRKRSKSPHSSSMASLRSSNLSQSIELNASLADTERLLTTSSSSNCDRLLGDTERKSKGLVREPVGLKSLRSRLERKSARRRRLAGDKNSNKPDLLTSPHRDQNRRSWSSLSEQISGKLNHFSHSWKQFLYNYNKRNKQSQDNIQVPANQCDEKSTPLARADEAHQEELKSMLSLKRRLTVDWVRHHNSDWLDVDDQAPDGQSGEATHKAR